MLLLYRVYWHNAATGGLELRIAKSLDMEKASTHDEGPAGFEADVLLEVAALERVAGVPGVVGLWQVVREPNGAVHLILECAPPVSP